MRRFLSNSSQLQLKMQTMLVKVLNLVQKVLNQVSLAIMQHLEKDNLAKLVGILKICQLKRKKSNNH